MEQTSYPSMSLQSPASFRFARWLDKIDIPPYERREDLFNAFSHFTGVLFGIVASAWSLSTMIAESAPVHAILGISIYCFTLIALYAVSGTYHVLCPGNAKRIMRVMDHCTIYLLIAGCYTPIVLVNFWGCSFAPLILAAEWGIALIGIIVNVLDMTARPVKVFSIISYIVMGWMIVLVPLDVLLSAGHGTWFMWVLAGGIAYTVGVVFYGIGSKRAYAHGIWHVFVLAGSILQFVGFAQLI